MRLAIPTLMGVCLHLIHSFNIDIISPYILTSGADNMFGFTVSFHKNKNGKYMLVGAPKAQTQQPDIVQGGAVYKCRVPDKIGDPREVVICDEELVEIDEEGDRFTTSEAEPGNYTLDRSKYGYTIAMERKSRQWMGVSVHSDHGDRFVVVCAHRYESRYLGLRHQITDPPRQLTGKCVVLNRELELENQLHPCLDLESGYESYGYCQAGTSATIIGRTAILGVPGSFKGTGGVVVYYDVTDIADNGLFTDNTSRRPGADGGTGDPSYMGYATAVCTLNSDNRPNVVAGGPRGNTYRGSVLVYEYDNSRHTVLRKRQLTGEQFGSYYGHSVVCADLTGDGTPDLVVGAPWWTRYSEGGSKPDVGRVYMYHGELDFIIDDFRDPVIIDGESANEAFGFSMASAGDLDHDGFGDLIVGSPYYNDGEGRIYLYPGSKDGISVTPSQIISPTQLKIQDGLYGFGWSISSQKDVDDNSYNDVLVGSWKSSHAVLLRTIKVVDVTCTLNFSKSEIHPKEGEVSAPDGTLVPGIEFSVCFRYTGEEAPSSQNVISIEFKVTLDDEEPIPRVHIDYENQTSRYYSRSIDIDTTNTTFCTKNVPVFYASDNFNNKPIKVIIDSNLNQDYNLPFDKRSVLNQKLINNAAITINIGFQCPKETRVCSTNITLDVGEVKYPGKKIHPLAIGKVEVITIPFKVTNQGPDFAYGTALQVWCPTIFQFIDNSKCKVGDTDALRHAYLIECDIVDPLKPETSKEWELEFNITQIEQPVNKNITAKAIVREPSIEVDANSTISVVILDIKNLADIKIRGGTSGNRVPFNNKFTIADKVYETIITDYDGPLVIHTYEIDHISESFNRYVKNITIEILWPLQFPNGAPLLPLRSVKYGIYPGGDNTTIHCDKITLSGKPSIKETFITNPPTIKYSNINCLTNASLCNKYICSIESLERGFRAKFTFYSNIQEYVLYNFDNITVTSTTKINSVEDSMVLPWDLQTRASATTTLYSSRFKRRSLLWIIIVAIIAGLILLLFIICALWRQGFFKRLRPEPEPAYTFGYLVNYEEEPFNAIY